MAGLKHSKRVSWAPGAKLCQVRLFLSEDAPYQSGLATQANLQAKGSWLLHATGTGTDDSLPPGFEAPRSAYQFNAELSEIPVVKWKCPRKFLLNPEWQVVAEEESKEVAVQNHRQARALEAIYPRQFNVPANPTVSTEVQESVYDDCQTPHILITAIEDEDSSEQLTTSLPGTGLSQSHRPDFPCVLTDFGYTMEQMQSPAAPASSSLPSETPPSGSSQIVEPDAMAAASAAFTAILRSNEEGSMIDQGLLINILNNPALLKLVSESGGAPQQTPSMIPSAASIPEASFPPVHLQTNISIPPHFSESRPSQLHPMSTAVPPAAVNAHSVTLNKIPAKPLIDASSMKNISYYKTLVQQHGGDGPGRLYFNPASAVNHQRNYVGTKSVSFSSQQRDATPKIAKPCMFFNSPKGCRRGDSCLYQHDSSIAQPTEQHVGSKRIKLDRGIVEGN